MAYFYSRGMLKLADKTSVLNFLRQKHPALFFETFAWFLADIEASMSPAKINYYFWVTEGIGPKILIARNHAAKDMRIISEWLLFHCFVCISRTLIITAMNSCYYLSNMSTILAIAVSYNWDEFYRNRQLGAHHFSLFQPWSLFRKWCDHRLVNKLFCAWIK